MRRRLLVILAGMCCLTACRPEKPSGPPHPGDPAPKLRLAKLLQAPEGTSTKWQHLRGNVVVLEFWGTMCAPCVAEIPRLNRLADDFADKPVRFLNITDEPEALIARFLKRTTMRGWIGFDTGGATARAYGVAGIPHTVVVDRNGLVVGHTRPEHVTAPLLDELLAGRTPELPPIGPIPDGSSASPYPSSEPALFKLAISPSREPPNQSGSKERDTLLEGKGWGIKRALSYACEIRATRVLVDEPLAGIRYDIELIWPEGEKETLKRMLHVALAASANFTAPLEEREMDVDVLTVRPGAVAHLQSTAVEVGMLTSTPGRISAVNKTTDDLSASLEPILGRPVLNETGLDGRYDWELLWERDQPDSLIAAVERQLGLQLIPAKRPVEVMVVEPREPGPGPGQVSAPQSGT